MNFQEKLKAELAAAQHNNNNTEVDYPSNHLKHKELRFEKDQNQLMIRILPPANDEDFFTVMARELWMNTKNRSGKDLNLSAVFPDTMNPDESNLVANLIQWQAREMVPNNFNKKAYPSRKSYVNVVQIFIDPQTNQFVHEVDQNGQLVVRLFKLPFSAYTAILGKLSDPMMKPQGSDDYGIISALDAFPIKIVKPVKGAATMSYTVDVYQRSLGALPPNWKDSLEDLKYQATPTEQYNSEYVQYFCDVVNGVEPVRGGGNGATTGNTGGGNQFQQPVVPQQQPQQQFNQMPQQPVMPQGGGQFNQFAQSQPMPTQNQFVPSPTQSVGTFTPAQPQGQFNQFAQQSQVVPVINDADLPFADMPDMGALAADPFPPVLHTGMGEPSAPVTGGLPDVNEILNRMKNNIG